MNDTTSNVCDLLPSSLLNPCTIIIFGGSGDLAKRKLIPALYSLFSLKKLPGSFSIVCCGRTDWDDSGFKVQLNAYYKDTSMDMSGWNEFITHIHFFSMRYDLTDFERLSKYLHQLDKKNINTGHRLFYLAVPPGLYPVIANLLGQSGLADEHTDTSGWVRIVVEKPFGYDLDSARTLNKTLHSCFKEEQIFRIDHYLAKETVQNVLIFRFANILFEPFWNRHYIDYIGIIASEDLGIGKRAGYYEKAGVIRDMFQNHLMQLLVLTAMEPPYRFETDAVQDEKAKVIRSLRNFNPKEGSRICLGQYQSGEIGGVAVKGYREESGVAPDSLTPTFALMELYVDNWRWHNVPFYMISGKRLPQKATSIVIQFREVPHQLFKNVLGGPIGANRLIIETYPEESIKLTFQTKNPGETVCLRSMTMDFVYHEHYKKHSLDAYSRVLLDCIAGEHMLFWRQDGIELSWSFLTPVLEQCEKCDQREKRLQPYNAGSLGPTQVRDIMHLFFGENQIS